MSARLLTTAVALCLSAAAGAQQIRTFTETASEPNALVYGLPVPLPINSLTPVDGFRSYASLEARLQALALESPDLAAHDIGRSTANRVQWAYVASDEDGIDVEGRPEAAFFINATTHAREWAAPEVATGTLERLLAGAGDKGIVRYVLDNTRVVVIPVQNVDGFLQTQRFPTQAILGRDPDFPDDWPRDGRMRRKNMPGVDEVLTTFADHLRGIDLNRNHPPLWATSVGAGGSSANPDSLTYHGTAPHSEAENLSLEHAAELGPATRIRMGVDVHTFSKVFYSSNTGRARLNAIQASLIDRLRAHHIQISGGKNYRDIPDPPNRGIGAAAEYFAYTWLVPAWTLELEPSNSAIEYGGTNVTHSGFILPASEARRVREAWAETHLIAFYMMAGPAHLKRVRFFEADSGRLALQLRWRWNAATGLREREEGGDGALQPGQRYRVELGFSKPMRYRNAQGVIVPIPGAAGVSRAVDVTLTGGAGDIALDTTAGEWLEDDTRILLYRNDTFAFEFDAPANVAEYGFEVGTRDFVGLALDADPSTPADWADGAWSAYEDAAGVAGDSGGVDGSTAAFSVGAVDPLPVEVVSATAVVGEGDAARIVLRRVGDGNDGELWVWHLLDSGEAGAAVQWVEGEDGDKVLTIPMPENTLVDGERVAELGLVAAMESSFSIGVPPPAATPRALPPVSVTVLDNDSAELAVVRSGSQGAGMFDAMSMATDAEAGDTGRSGATALVIDRADAVAWPPRVNSAQLPAEWVVGGPLAIYANHARIEPESRESASRYLLRNAAAGELLVDAVDLRAGSRTLRGFLTNAGQATIRRSVIGPGLFNAPPILNTGTLHIARSALIGASSNDNHTVRNEAGTATFEAATLGNHAALELLDGIAELRATTLARNGIPVVGGQDSPVRMRYGHMLWEGNVGLVFGIPPPLVCPDGNTYESLDYNLADVALCGFDAPHDRDEIDIVPAEFDPVIQSFAPTGPAIDTGATAGDPVENRCGPIDQRGAPRPQTLAEGAEPRCDIGAIELGVNPYRGIWAPERSGHGLDLQTTGNTLLMAWYTYADDGQPTAYQAAAPLTGRHWQATLQASRRNPQGVVSVVDVGQVRIDFVSDVEATLSWRFDARGVDSSETIRASLFDDGTPRFEVTGLWFPPGEPNYGATITRRGETTALGLYYYDANGIIRWALGTGSAADAVDLAMTSFTGFCPDCDPAQMPVVGTPAGRVLAHFRTPERARLDIELTYPGAAGGTWNRPQTRFVPLNDPVDNRAAAALLVPVER